MSNRTPDETRQLIESLDLSGMRLKLALPECEGWGAEKIALVERQYRNFLWLWCKYGGDLPPPTDVDKFWHHHILDTERYHRDCEEIFGGYLHHFPYFGLRGAEDAVALDDGFEASRRAYQLEFGEDIVEYVEGAMDHEHVDLGAA